MYRYGTTCDHPAGRRISRDRGISEPQLLALLLEVLDHVFHEPTRIHVHSESRDTGINPDVRAVRIYSCLCVDSSRWLCGDVEEFVTNMVAPHFEALRADIPYA